ncbi:O-antigen ligase family protein [Granulicella arctica]|uniref:O-antigen ligase family protein n=1 Tax=Granulicella arctica TaxID=940613 RepID=UPI0021DFAE98|nr:O-antigen ligase family protein [Granulicella arctica]
MPSALRYLYPALAFALAIFLFVRSRTIYIGFVFWLWFVSPFLRRIVDYRAGFVPSSPLLLASFLATAVSGYVLVTRVRMLSRPALLPFSCALAGIFFGTVVGFTRYPVVAVMQAVLNWLVPILFAFFLYAERDRYVEYQEVIQRSFLYGTLWLGAYGVYQFFFLPLWDRQWMIDLDARTFGVPEALQIRVFSTLNAPATCAAYLMAGLLILFALKSRIRFVAAPVAFLAFILTSSRSSWIGLVFGIFYLTVQLSNKARVRVVAGILTCVILLLVATQLPVLDVMVSTRLQSFTDPKKDVSYNERVGGHVVAFEKLLDEPMGEGMGSVDTDHTTTGGDASIGPHDSSILESLYSLGFPGSIVYLAGIIVAGFTILFRVKKRSSDLFAIAIRAVIIAFFCQFYLNSIFVGAFGFVVWTAIGMALAQGTPKDLSTASLKTARELLPVGL